MTVEATGSNNWAVAPSRSATGGALIAGDPHLVAHDAGHRLPDGATAGRPLLPRARRCRARSGIAFGHNNDVAWTLTNAMADVMDLFVERIEGDRYVFGDERRDLTEWEEEIDGPRARPGPDGR